MSIDLALTLGFPILVLIAVLLSDYRQKQRPLWLQAFAKVIGFSFVRATNTPINKLRFFAPFTPDLLAWDVKNMLVGTKDGVSIEIFDFSAKIIQQRFLQQEEQRTTRVQTYIHFTANRLELPHFALRPKTTQTREHHYLGESFFRIKGNLEFFQNYIVQADDETAVRSLFDEEVCNHFARLLTKSVEGRGNQLLYYYEGHLISHERIDEFLEEAMQVFNLFATKSKVQSVLKESYG